MTQRPVRAVESATVILARVSSGIDTPWECFMVRRHVKSDFAADAYVFPGGKVDPADRRVTSGDPVLGDTRDELLAFRLAAIRELFEEAGVLLAVDSFGEPVRFADREEERFVQLRRRVQSGEISILELARAEGVFLAPGMLEPISRWITPESFPRRFDTYFFLAMAPEGQQPLHDALETTDGLWIPPAEALARSRRGEFPLVFATERHLERLAVHESPEAVVAGMTPAGLQPVMPRSVQRGDETVYLVPGDAGY